MDYKAIHVYCDEPADRTLFLVLASASNNLRQIPKANVTVYPGYEALGPAREHILNLVREDRPDFIFTYRNRPFLVVEITEHGYTGDNPLQRFTRFATTAEERVPFVYFTPFARTRDDELDRATDPTTLSKRRVNTNVFVGMLRLAEIFRVPMIALDWPMVTIAALAIGFLATFATLMYSMEGTFVIRQLRDIDAYPVLLRYILFSIYVWTTVIVIALISTVIDHEGIDPLLGYTWLRWLGSLWAAATAAGFLASHRVLRIMFALLRYKDRTRRQQAEAPHELIESR